MPAPPAHQTKPFTIPDPAMNSQPSRRSSRRIIKKATQSATSRRTLSLLALTAILFGH